MTSKFLQSIIPIFYILGVSFIILAPLLNVIFLIHFTTFTHHTSIDCDNKQQRQGIASDNYSHEVRKKHPFDDPFKFIMSIRFLTSHNL